MEGGECRPPGGRNILILCPLTGIMMTYGDAVIRMTASP